MPAAPPKAIANQDARFQLLETLLMALEGGEHCRHFVSERDVGATAIEVSRYFFVRVRQMLTPSMSFSTRASASRICMMVAVRPEWWCPKCDHFSEPARLHESRNHRQHRIADSLGRFLEFRHVDLVGEQWRTISVAAPSDDAKFGRARAECRLEVE